MSNLAKLLIVGCLGVPVLASTYLPPPALGAEPPTLPVEPAPGSGRSPQETDSEQEKPEDRLSREAMGRLRKAPAWYDIRKILREELPLHDGEKASQLLDRAQQELEVELADYPRRKAVVREAFGLLYQQIGRLDRAEALLRSALVVNEAELGKEHVWTLDTLSNLASLLRNRKRFDEAESLFRRVLEVHRRTLGKEHPGTAWTIFLIGNLFMEWNKPTEAEPWLVKALEIQEHAYPVRSVTPEPKCASTAA